MARIPRPPTVVHYQIAGRFLTANFPDPATADSAHRSLSALTASRVFDSRELGTIPNTLTLFRENWEIPAARQPCFVSTEAGAEAAFYSGGDSYLVRIGESTVVAGTGPNVLLAMSEQLDSRSFLFERVLTHGVAAGLRRAGAFELQCAAVIDPETAVSALIVGPSGSGKSTLAVQLAASGWGFSSDDVVLLTDSRAGIEAFGLRNHFALTAETITKSNLPGVNSILQAMPFGDDHKYPLMPQAFFPHQHVRKCAPGLLIFAQRTETSRSRFAELDQSKAMKRLMKICPWACLDLPVAQRFLDVLGRLSRQCRAFDLFSGTDLLGDRHYTANFLSSIINQKAA